MLRLQRLLFWSPARLRTRVDAHMSPHMSLHASMHASTHLSAHTLAQVEEETGTFCFIAGTKGNDEQLLVFR